MDYKLQWEPVEICICKQDYYKAVLGFTIFEFNDTAWSSLTGPQHLSYEVGLRWFG